MAEHSFRNIETGGEGERSRTHENEERLSWRERLKRRLSKKHEAERADESRPAEREVSFVAFFTGIFREPTPESSQDTTPSWIEQAFAERDESTPSEKAPVSAEAEFAALPEQERTEFHMVVAQRFKDAGNRFVAYIQRITHSEHEQADEPVSPIENIREEVAEEAPPFEFVEHAIDEAQPDQQTEQIAQPDVPTEYDRSDYSYPERVTTEVTPVFEKQKGEVTYRVYRNSWGEVLIGSGAVAHASNRRTRKKLERKFDKRLKNEQQRVEKLEHTQAELEQIVKSQEDDIAELERRQEEFQRTQEKKTVRPPRPERKEIKEVAFDELPKRSELPKRVEEQFNPLREALKKAMQEDVPVVKTEAESANDLAVEAEKLRQQALERLRNLDTSSNEAEQAPVRVERRTEVVERTPETSTQVSVDEVLYAPRSAQASTSAYRQEKAKPDLRERMKVNYDITQPSGVNNWMITGVILALILISALFLAF